MRIKLFTTIDYNENVDDYIIDFSHDKRNGFAFYYWDSGILPESVKFLVESLVMDKYSDKDLDSLENDIIKITGSDDTDWKIVG